MKNMKNMKNKKFLTNKEKEALKENKEKMIIESFKPIFNKIKRLNENYEEKFNQGETLQDYLIRMGDDLPINKYDVGDTVLMDMGDGSQETLTINRVKYFKPPKEEFTYAYYTEEYADNMLFIEPMVIKRVE